MLGELKCSHYNDVISSATASQITSLTIVYSAVYSGADQRKHQSSASLAFVRGIHRGPVNSPQKGSVTRKMFPFDDVIMTECGWMACISLSTFSQSFNTMKPGKTYASVFWPLPQPDTKSLPEPRLTYCQLDPKEQTSVRYQLKLGDFHSRNCK